MSSAQYVTNPDWDCSMTMYDDAVLEKLVQYCKRHRKSTIQRCDLAKACALPPAILDRAINSLERQGLVKNDDESIPGQTWLVPNFKAARRKSRSIKRIIDSRLMSDEVTIEVRDPEGRIKKIG